MLNLLLPLPFIFPVISPVAWLTGEIIDNCPKAKTTPDKNKIFKNFLERLKLYK